MAYLTGLVLDLLSKLMEKTEGGTYDRSTDSNEAISEAIAGIGGGLSDKEKAFIGVAGQPTLNEYFLTVAHNASPDAAIWSTVTDGDATIKVMLNVADSYCLLNGDSAAVGDCVLNTLTKKFWDIDKPGTTTIFCKTSMKIDDLTGEAGIGLVLYGADKANDMKSAGQFVATIHCDNDVVNAVSSDGSVAETTDLSAYFSDNTYAEIEIRITTSDVTFYVDGTLRATHSTRVPDRPKMFMAATKNTNGIDTSMYIKYVEVWVE